MLILDPDRDSQPVLIKPAMIDRTFEGATATLRSVFGDVVRSLEDTMSDGERQPCHHRYGSLVDAPRCLNLLTSVVPGTTYELEVESADRPTATATTTVPAAFDFVTHFQEGTLPGTARVGATWRASAGTHRYIVTIQGQQIMDDGDGCGPDFVCFDRWLLVTSDTTFAATVDAKYFEEARGPWRLVVYAMNLDAFGYLMSGESNRLFPVPPRQNVTNGFGAVGAWVIRSVPLN